MAKISLMPNTVGVEDAVLDSAGEQCSGPRNVNKVSWVALTLRLLDAGR